jgi:murein DD-endopeptidase MepM/ murein hydrolase activator NlpD
MTEPVVLDFPLRSEWIAPATPGKKVPSHGTDALGLRYAYDFVGVEPGSQDKRFYRANPLRYLLFGVPLRDCYGWGRPIFAATAGTVIQAEDGWPERDPVHPARDVALMLQNGWAFNVDQTPDLRSLSGNYVIVESTEGYACYFHAQTGSIRVAAGDKVTPGQHLANVGHSGNSTAPHLHFHLMDHPDPRQARGILCCFRDYEVFDDGAWRAVRNGIPKDTDRIRKQP